MMNEEIDATEFYQQDFTTASDWEVFIARIEEIIKQWETEKNRTDIESQNLSSSSKWIIKSEKLTFVDFAFDLFYYKKNKQSDISSSEKEKLKFFDILFDFDLICHENQETHECLSYWYGLNEYFVLTPANNAGIISESRIKLLLSSCYVAAGNISDSLPIFVQIREKWQKCYLGVYEAEGYRTNYEMVHLKKIPQNCQHLSGLLSLFTSKIMSPTSLDPVIVSVQFSYDLQNFGNFEWMTDYSTYDSDLGTFTKNSLPFGVNIDPIKTVTLKATWSNLPDYVVIDSENYSDFDPVRAQKWSVCTDFTEKPNCLLDDALMELHGLLGNESTVSSILGDSINAAPVENNPLDLLTESKVPTLGSFLSRAAKSSLSHAYATSKGSVPILEDDLGLLLYYLFPDAKPRSFNAYALDELDKIDNLGTIKEDWKGIKSCLPDSLVWRLAIVIVHCLQSLGGVKAVAHIWYEFVQEMRYRWDKSIKIPGLPQEFPDLGTCLIHQKLQLLNCCIAKKVKREGKRINKQVDSEEDSSTDEEFYDCADKPEEEVKRKPTHFTPSGRLRKLDDLKLIETGEPLYVPVTQDLVPKTEDQLEKDTDVLLKLGGDAQGSELRARMMSASLLSDMESFKAANPGAILEDFVRWYSPRDWNEIDEEDQWGQKKGQLSNRMLIENNIWAQMWETSQAVPANRQKRLFDDTCEAEQVLRFLEMCTLSQICEYLLPVIFHVSIYTLGKQINSVIEEMPELYEDLLNIIKQTERYSRNPIFRSHRVETIIYEMSLLELKLLRIFSLYWKLKETDSTDESTKEVLKNLISGNEVVIEKDSEIAGRVKAMFGEVQRNINLVDHAEDDEAYPHSIFPMPNQREFVMKLLAVKPATYSMKCPQYLKAILTKSDFRLVGAFSEDTVFF